MKRLLVGQVERAVAASPDREVQVAEDQREADGHDKQEDERSAAAEERQDHEDVRRHRDDAHAQARKGSSEPEVEVPSDVHRPGEIGAQGEGVGEGEVHEVRDADLERQADGGNGEHRSGDEPKADGEHERAHSELRPARARRRRDPWPLFAIAGQPSGNDGGLDTYWTTFGRGLPAYAMYVRLTLSVCSRISLSARSGFLASMALRIPRCWLTRRSSPFGSTPFWSLRARSLTASSKASVVTMEYPGPGAGQPARMADV